jgi:hypothetical protein
METTDMKNPIGNDEKGNDVSRLLAAALDYLKTEREKIYESRMYDDVDYDEAIYKVDAFKVVEKHIRKSLIKRYPTP